MKTTWIIIGLAVALIASNALWGFWVINAGYAAAYREDVLKDNHEGLKQALALMPVLARPGVTRPQILEEARKSCGWSDPWEKDGVTHVGRLTLRFDSQGRLVEATAAWKPFDLK